MKDAREKISLITKVGNDIEIESKAKIRDGDVHKCGQGEGRYSEEERTLGHQGIIRGSASWNEI